MTRYCKIFFCDHRRERYCCADCPIRKDCFNPCMNWPSRCGQEDAGKRRGAVTAHQTPAATEENGGPETPGPGEETEE